MRIAVAAGARVEYAAAGSAALSGSNAAAFCRCRRQFRCQSRCHCRCPGPFESLITFESGSPQLFMLGLGNFSSGGPRTVGVIAKRASDSSTTFGGVSTASSQILAACRGWRAHGSCAPPPPPPPAFLAPGGSFGKNGEIVVISTLEFALVVAGEISSGSNGTMISTRITTWNSQRKRLHARELRVLRPDLLAPPRAGWWSSAAASFGGEIDVAQVLPEAAQSRIPIHQQIGIHRALRAPARKNSFRLSLRLSPKPGVLNPSAARPTCFTGRSVRKSLRLEKKFLRSDSRDGRRVAPDLQRRFRLRCLHRLIESAVNVCHLSCLVPLPQSALILDAPPRKRMSGRARLTPLKIHCNIRVASFAAQQLTTGFARQSWSTGVCQLPRAQFYLVKNGKASDPLQMAKALDLKSTLNLPKTDFPMKAKLPEREPEQLAAWEAAWGSIAASWNRARMRRFSCCTMGRPIPRAKSISAPA